ncbi:hypothetical protein ACFSQ7_25870 [Paenibacillus rhizoplanae]
MTLSYYHSLKTIPRELNEAAAMNRLGGWHRFTKLEAPFFDDRSGMEQHDVIWRRLVFPRSQ